MSVQLVIAEKPSVARSIAASTSTFSVTTCLLGW